VKKRLFSLITDCQDPNAAGRVTTRLAGLLSVTTMNPIGVENDLEAGLCLVDQLDALGSSPGIILVNVAPRNGNAKRWKNGTPFAWFRHENTFVFGTIGGHAFSLLQKILGKELVANRFDLAEAAEYFGFSEEMTAYIISTQFRSYEFLPRAAAMVVNGIKLPASKTSDIPKVPQAVVWIDCFDNVKTSILQADIGFSAGKQVEFRTNGSTHWLHCYDRLKDVPDGESGLVVGSSGLWVGNDNRRFLEIVVQGGRAADRFKLLSGAKIEIRSY
jgi:hypothetical protein